MTKEFILMIIMEVELLFLIVVQFLKMKKTYKKVKLEKQSVVDTLTSKKIEDDLVIEKDKDLVLIDTFMEYIKSFIEDYHRTKKLTYRKRQDINYETFKIVATISKYITLDYYYDLDDEEFTKLSDKELMKVLETSYNDYTHDNLESLNRIITIALRLRDDK